MIKIPKHEETHYGILIEKKDWVRLLRAIAEANKKYRGEK